MLGRVGNGTTTSTINVRNTFAIRLQVLARSLVSRAEISIRIINSRGHIVTTTNLSKSSPGTTFAQGTYNYVVHLPELFLSPDLYSLSLAIHEPNVRVYDLHEYVLQFRIEEIGSDMSKYHGLDHGAVLSSFPWEPIGDPMAKQAHGTPLRSPLANEQ